MSMGDEQAQIWDLWIAGVGAQGAAFARGRLDATEVLLVHAAPDALDVDVRDDGGALLARGKGLRRTADTPMARLRRDGGGIIRDDVWPSHDDIGRTVIVMGGEVGVLTSWWNADDQQQWRWSLEFYNHR